MRKYVNIFGEDSNLKYVFKKLSDALVAALSRDSG